MDNVNAAKIGCNYITQPQPKEFKMGDPGTNFCSTTPGGIRRQCNLTEGLSADNTMDFATADEEIHERMDTNISNASSLDLEGLDFLVENYCSLLEEFDPKNDSSEKLEFLLNDLNKIKVNLSNEDRLKVVLSLIRINSPKISEYLKEDLQWIQCIPKKSHASIIADAAFLGESVDTVSYLINVCKLDDVEILNRLDILEHEDTSKENRLNSLMLLVHIDSEQVAQCLKNLPQWTKDMTEGERAGILVEALCHGHIDTAERLIKDFGFNIFQTPVYANEYYSGSLSEYNGNRIGNHYKSGDNVNGQFQYIRFPNNALDAILLMKNDRKEALINMIDLAQNDKLGRFPIHYAARNCDVDVLKNLLCRPEVNPNIEDGEERTPLYYSLANNLDIRSIRALLSHPKCIIKTEGKKNIFEAIKNHKHRIDSKTIDLIAYYSDPKDLELFKQYAPWLKDLHNGKFQSIQEYVKEYEPLTENIKKFISEILDTESNELSNHRQLKNSDILSSLKGVRNLSKYASPDEKSIAFIKLRYFFDKNIEMETGEVHQEIQMKLKEIMQRCMSQGDFQSIHGLAALGLTNEKFKKDSLLMQTLNEYEKLKNFVEGESPCKREVVDAVLKSGFLNKYESYALYSLTVSQNQESLAEICHKYNYSIAFINTDNNFPFGVWGINPEPNQQCLDKTVKKMESLGWKSEFIYEVANRGLITLKSGETMYE